MKNIQSGSMVVGTNILHNVLGIGFVQDVRGTQAKVEFRPTVFSKPPYLTESKIIDIEELKVVKPPVERLKGGDFDDPWKFELLQKAAHLLVCNYDGQLGNARTDLLPHQITIAHDVVSTPRRRFLIADEVGLGKTIETGIIIYTLQQKGHGNRILIITPAGLTLQWQEEMQEKFGITFAVYKEDVSGVLAFDQNDLVIASIDTLKLDNRRKKGQVPSHKELVVGSRDWDIIIFDEAHKLSAKTWSEKKTDKTLNYRLAEELSDHCNALLFLTATPHQGDESKFQNLLKLLHENVVFDDWAQESPDSVPYTSLVLRNRKSKVCDAEGNPIFKGIDIHPVRVQLMNTGERKFHKALEEYLIEGYGYAKQDPGDKQRKAIGFVMTTFQKLAASSTRAIKSALERRRDNLKRKAEKAAELEEGEYDSRFEGEYEVIEASKVIDPFIETEIDMLERLISLSVPEDGKEAELFRVIDSVATDNTNQLVLIFTEYIATQNFIIEMSENRFGEGCTTRIRGGMSLWDKKRSMSEFRDNPNVRFLVSTEAGGEGINLQFAHVMINYDQPWNPFRLAQRYGRLYRYGQDKVVQVFNFQISGTIEDKVRQYLEEKTKRAATRLSKISDETVEEIEDGLLGFYDELLDYEKIYRDGLAKGNLKPSKSVIDDGIKQAENAYKLAYNSLFSKDIVPFNPDRFTHEIKSPLTLKDVEVFVTEFVKHHGRNFSKVDDGSWEFILPQCLQDVKGLEKRYSRVTFDRAGAIRHSELDFLALGHSFTDAAIDFCGSVDFGGFCASRVVEEPSFSGLKGLHFNFLVKRTRRSSDGEVVSFDLVPVFVELSGNLNDRAGKIALLLSGGKASDAFWRGDLNFVEMESIARDSVIGKYEGEIWDEDVVCLNVCLTEFI